MSLLTRLELPLSMCNVITCGYLSGKVSDSAAEAEFDSLHRG